MTFDTAFTLLRKLANSRSSGLVFFSALMTCLCIASNAIADEFQSEAAAVWLNSPQSDWETNLNRESRHFYAETSPVRQAMMMQPTPFLAPRVSIAPELPSAAAPSSRAGIGSSFGSQLIGRFDRNQLSQSTRRVSAFSDDLILGDEAMPLVSTDVGSLLRKSSRALSVQSQKRSPIVNDTRIRSSRIGALAASGSHWVPARADLDTVLSKFDSRAVSNVLVTPGPFSSLYGPGFQFVEFDVNDSPRYSDDQLVHGQTGFEHQSNGNQWLANQSLSTGAERWGLSANYSHRWGDNYRTGDGDVVSSGYESRELTLAYGFDFRDGSSLELSLLRLDQTDVDFPGYVFDIDSLVTDGYSITYVDPNVVTADLIETDIWYNRTRFEGNAQDASKRELFPLLDRINYRGFTDVDSMSTGYRRTRTWGKDADAGILKAGHDLRFVKQELNEIGSGQSLGLPIPFTNQNSPIPRSFAANPGLFAQYEEQFLGDWTLKTGGRIDYVQTDIVDEKEKLAAVGLDLFQASFAEVVGTDVSQTDRVMGSLYASLTRQFSSQLVGNLSLGYAERAPTLTELYAAQPFLLLVQNGLNNVTGDPLLKKEKLIQLDLSLDYQSDGFRAGIRGFHGWAMDYITFENTSVTNGPPNGLPQQVSLRYVNTDLATLTGVESFAELFPKKRLTPYVNMRFVDGRDRTRDGDFATSNGSQGNSSQKVSGSSRGFFSGIDGSDAEALPGISPLETRLGIRWRNNVNNPTLNLDLSARIVDNQDRVATSLLENATAGFTVYDIRSTYSPKAFDNLVIVSGIENVTNKTYREHLDFRSADGVSIFQSGFNFYVGANLSY